MQKSVWLFATLLFITCVCTTCKKVGYLSVGFYNVENLFDTIGTKIAPMWVYNLQPGNIKVSGEIQLQIKMPRLFGSFDYIPPTNTPVLLMGLDSNSLKLKPIGVGTIINNTVVSQGRVVTKRLDYLGYTLVSAEQAPLLQEYLNGQISLNQLTAKLLQ